MWTACRTWTRPKSVCAHDRIRLPETPVLETPKNLRRAAGADRFRGRRAVHPTPPSGAAHRRHLAALRRGERRPDRLRPLSGFPVRTVVPPGRRQKRSPVLLPRLPDACVAQRLCAFRYFFGTISGSSILTTTSWAGNALRWPKPHRCFSPDAKVVAFQSVRVSKIPVYVRVRTLDFTLRCISLICCSTRSM